MSRRRPRSRAYVRLLVLLIVPLAGLVATEIYFPDYFVRNLPAASTIVPQPAGPADTNVAARQDGPTVPGERAFAVIALRPLFSRTRRPPDQPKAPTKTPAMENLGQFVVTGVITSGGNDSAILKYLRPGPRQETGLVVRTGDTVEGWTVETIEDDRVTFTRGEERQVLELKAANKRKPRAIPRQRQPGAPPVPRQPAPNR